MDMDDADNVWGEGTKGVVEGKDGGDTVLKMFDLVLDSDIKHTRNQVVHTPTNAETKPLERINKLFRPLAASSRHLTPSDVAVLNRTKTQCHHHHHHNHHHSNNNQIVCNCTRTINRNKYMRTYHFRQNRREQSIQTNRGDIMGFVFKREQIRDDSRLEEASKTNHDAFVESLLDDCDYDVEYDADCDDDENLQLNYQSRQMHNKTQPAHPGRVNIHKEDIDQYELEQFIIQEQLEMEALMDNLTLGL